MPYPSGSEILDANADKPPLNNQRSGISPDALAIISSLTGGGGSGGGGAQVTSSQYQYDAVPSSFTPATSGATVFTLASGDMGFIQNLSTNPLFVKLGAGASSSSFSYILKGGTGADDGTGGLTNIKDHIGAVSVAGTSPRFIAWSR